MIKVKDLSKGEGGEQKREESEQKHEGAMDNELDPVEREALRGPGKKLFEKSGDDDHCKLFQPAGLDGAQASRDAVDFMEDSYNGKRAPHPKPQKGRGGPWKYWLLTEKGYVDRTDSTKDSLYVPKIRLKCAWIPDELRGLTRGAYQIMEEIGSKVPDNYGALLMLTRME